MQIGSKQLSADGYVDSTNATRVYEVIVKSGDASTVALKNANTTEYDSIALAAAGVTRVVYAGGLLFPGGCYIDVDANTTYATVIYERE